MALILRDTFTGSGDLNGHTPDITFGGYSWAGGTGQLTRSGGLVTSLNNANTNDQGSLSLGNSSITVTSLETGGMAFSFKTGPDVGANADGHYGFSLSLGFGTVGETTTISASAGTDGVWYLGIQFGAGSSVVTVAANTTYTGTLTFSNGAQSLTMFGSTVTAALPTTGGLNYVWMIVGSTTSISALDIYDAGGPVTTGSGAASLTCPKGTIAGNGGTSVATGNASLIAPMGAVLTSSGGYLRSTSPAGELFTSGHDASGERSALLVAPMASLRSFSGGTISVSAPEGTLAATGAIVNLATSSMSAPTGQLVGIGTVASIGGSSISPSIGSLIGYAGAVLSIRGPNGSVTSTGAVGAVGSSILTLPLFELLASGKAINSGKAVLEPPMLTPVPSGVAAFSAPNGVLTAIGTAVVAITYEAYALNLNHRNPDSPDELTRYTNYPFDRIVRYENSYFGMNATGLYLLEGTTDFAEPTPTKVPWRFKTGLTDFDSPNLKTVNWAYFGGRMAPAATISIHYGDTGEQNYAYSTPRGAEAQNYRQPFGRGIKSRYYAVEAEGSGALSIDSMMFDIASMARKV